MLDPDVSFDNRCHNLTLGQGRSEGGIGGWVSQEMLVFEPMKTCVCHFKKRQESVNGNPLHSHSENFIKTGNILLNFCHFAGCF
jgi:hypothetical protein